MGYSTDECFEDHLQSAADYEDFLRRFQGCAQNPSVRLQQRAQNFVGDCLSMIGGSHHSGDDSFLSLIRGFQEIMMDYTSVCIITQDPESGLPLVHGNLPSHCTLTLTPPDDE